MRVPHFLPTDPAQAVSTIQPPDPMALLFPFRGEYQPTLDAAVDLSRWPKKISVTKAVEWYWRVKTWNMKITGVDAGGFPEQNIELFIGATFIPEGSAGHISDERDLCDGYERAPYGHTLVSDSPGNLVDIDIGADNLQITPTLYLFGADGQYPPQYKMTATTPPIDDAQMIPQIGFFINVTWTGGAGGIMSGRTYEHPDAGTYGDSTISIDGEVIPIRWDSSGHIGNIEIYITPKTWWPYALADGTHPIYDAATGAQLRNPVTAELI
jgi:hypothetical protein